ncbi:uncharacterized protein LOC143463516 isoform X2 [Clavelina lepadiformis]|uniref:uncharacterized protein LOC143463516 isoform X2 n=1 Tax=Clavelina lepadiformis TaxID=159417 RepID=UPI0040424E41
MYSMEELKTWWEVPAIAHFFSLFKSCFSLTDFTIEELEECLLTDGEDDKSTIFTSRLLTQLLQGCYSNPNISVTTYHDTLLHIMKKRWEEEDGRVNPLSSANADFHSLPTMLKVQIIHRLTEYRLDANDVVEKLSGLNPSDLRLEPLGSDRNGSKYWYFFGVRLYKETPPAKKPKKRKREAKLKKKELKKMRLHSMETNGPNSKLLNGGFGEDSPPMDFLPAEESSHNDGFTFPGLHLFKKKSKKKSKKHKKSKNDSDDEDDASYFSYGRLARSKWEVVCYNVNDWKKLARKLGKGESRREEVLRRLITDNFLPNLPKIVEDMEQQRLAKEQMELLPRRSSCRILAKKLYEAEEEETPDKRIEALKLEKEEHEKVQSKEREERMNLEFEKLLKKELERKKKFDFDKQKQEKEEEKMRRLSLGLPPESESSSDEGLSVSSSAEFDMNVDRMSKHQAPHKNRINKGSKKTDQNLKKTREEEGSATSKRRGRPPTSSSTNNSKASKKVTAKLYKSNERMQKLSKTKEKLKPEELDKRLDEERKEGDEEEWDDGQLAVKAGDHECKVMKEAWDVIDTHPDAWPFEKPVEEWYAPGYYNIIKRPIDLSQIEAKLMEKKYKTVLEFKDDITLMFNNCRLYNGPESEYTEVANTLDKTFKKTLFIGLSRQQTDNKVKTNKSNNKPCRKKKPENAGGYILADPQPVDDQYMAYINDEFGDGIEEEQEDSEESSDEFTPPGVSKIKLRKARMEFAKKIWQGADSKGAKTSASRGRGRQPSATSTKGKILMDAAKPLKRKEKHDEASSSSEKSDATPIENKTQPKKRGRPAKSTAAARRGRKASAKANRKVTSESKEANSDSSDGDGGKTNISHRQRGRGRPTNSRGRGSGEWPSAETKKTKSSDTNSSSSEATGNDSDVIEKDVKKDQEDSGGRGILDSAPKLANPLRLPEENTDDNDGEQDAGKLSDSLHHDAESSSSSSRASSRSHSLEKFEKLKEDAKSKPQVLWSLDYLASQARVLEEQYQKTESTSNKPSGRKQSSQSSTPSGDLKSSENDQQRKSLPSPQRLLKSQRKDITPFSGANNRKSDLDDNHHRDMGRSTKIMASSNTSKSIPPGGRRREDSDVYSFNDDDASSNIFGEKSRGPPGQTCQDPSNHQDRKQTMTTGKSPASGYPNKSSSFSSPGFTSSHTSRTTETKQELRNNELIRRASSDQLSSPQTPSSGYRTASSGHYSSSPYTGSETSNSVASRPSQESDSDRYPKLVNVQKQDCSVPAQTKAHTTDSSAVSANIRNQKPDINNQPGYQRNSKEPPVKAPLDRVSSAPTEVNSSGAINFRVGQNLSMPQTQSSHTSHVNSSKGSSSMASTNIVNVPASSSHNPGTSPNLPPSQIPINTSQMPLNRRHSQHQVGKQPHGQSPSSTFAQKNESVTSNSGTKISEPSTNNQHPDSSTTLRPQNAAMPLNVSTQHTQHPRVPSFNLQTQATQPINSGHHTTSMKQQGSDHPAQPPGPSVPHGFEQRSSNRKIDSSFRNTTSSSSNMQQHTFNYGVSNAPSTGATHSTGNASTGRGSSSTYHQQATSSSDTNVVMQNPTMANFGLTPWSLSQPQHSDMNNPSPHVNAQRKTSSSSGGFTPQKPSGHSQSVPSQPQQPQQPQQQQSMQAHRTPSSHPYHGSTTSMTSTKAPPPNMQSGGHPPVKHRNPSTSSNTDSHAGSNVPASKHHQRHSNASNTVSSGASGSAHTGSGQSAMQGSAMSAASRRHSGNASQYQKDYMGYHIPPTPAPTPRDVRTSAYSPHQQNGLLSSGAMANNNAALLHQDLTASATLRALQQQHKTDRPTHPAAASMLHYAAAAAAQQSQGAVAAASEQYNRLAASAHHRATSQHAHALAGVYHPHAQNVSTSSAQAAAHLSTPWLQAAPGAGYPSNLLPHPHIDPVYQLMQQSGMHGQYPMYSNPVMQQLHQQQLHHRMLPKY